MIIEERKKRYNIMEKVKELKRKLRGELGEIDIDVEYDSKRETVEIGRKKHRWTRKGWEKVR